MTDKVYLELFSGTKSVAKQFYGRWRVMTIDNNPDLYPDWCTDILTIQPKDIVEKIGHPDVIWASPPCQAFTVSQISRNWEGSNYSDVFIPKTEKAKIGIALVEHTLFLIEHLRPTYWFIENPMGMLRKIPIMKGLPRYLLTYCQYGDNRMKPTDIWTNHPDPQFLPACKQGDSCHPYTPRGSRNGTQGLANSLERGKIPEALCRHINKICEEGSYD